MTNDAYTHALTLQLGSVPLGYYPVGTRESLGALAREHQKAGLTQTEMTLYALKHTNGIATPQLNERTLMAKFGRVVKGDDEITLSTADVRAMAKPITNHAKGAFKAGGTVLVQLLKGKAEAKDVTSLVMEGQAAVMSAVDAGKTVFEGVQEMFWHDRTEDFLRNDQGVFVSQQWLDNAVNAERLTKVRLKPLAAAPR